MKDNCSIRRVFLKKSAMAATGLSLGLNVIATSGSRIVGANDKIRMGFIGVGNRGSQLLKLFMARPDCEVAALCDLYEPYLARDFSKVDRRYTEGYLGKEGRIPKMGENFPNKVARYADYRELLEDRTIDAVCIATPDHWHAMQTIDSIKAGKDVYVEKPMTITIHEGRSMINALRASSRIAQVGLNRRGNVLYQNLAKEMQSGKIGKITVGRAAHINNMVPDGIGRMQPEAPPTGFDWDTWLGPRAYIPYKFNIAPYTFRWWSDYSSKWATGAYTIWTIRWLMEKEHPWR
jgi:predicted dehydrogenase